MFANGKRLFLVNVIAVLAYLSVVLQWLLAVLPFVPRLAKSDLFKTYVSNLDGQAQQAPSMQIAHTEGYSWVFVVIAAVIGVIVLVTTIIAMKRAPATIGKTGAKLTRSAAEKVLPVFTHHQKITPQKRRLLTARIVFDIKLVLVVLPLLIAFVSPVDTFSAMPRDMFLFISAVIAGWSLLMVCLQLGFARWLRVDLSRTW